MPLALTPMDSTDAQIFDAKQYDLPIPTQDGHKADRLAVNVSGSVELDRTSEEELEFLNGLKLGDEVKLLVTATVSKVGFTISAGKEDSPEQTGYGVGLRVHSVEVA